MQLELQTLTLKNFKGARLLTINFEHETNITGDNGTCKTTIFDAFTWLLFDKNSHDEKDFSVKTLDSSGIAIPMVDHEVSGIITVDGKPVELKKVYVEKWTKKRGSETSEFTGHETTYFYNGVPCTMKEYKVKIETLCNESLFRLLTNPLYFPNLKWQDQRELVFEIAGAMSDKDIAKGSERFTELLNSLNGKTLDEYKREIASKKNKIKTELEQIPARVDEVKRSIPEVVNGLDKEKTELEASIKCIDDAILDTNKANQKANREKLKNQTDIFDLQAKQNNILHAENKKANDNYHTVVSQREELARRIKDIERDIQDANSRKERNSKEATRIQASIDSLRLSFAGIRDENFTLNENEVSCPLCKREFDNITEKKNELISNFNSSKAKRLAEINDQGVKLKEELKQIANNSELINAELIGFTHDLNTCQDLLSNIQTPEFKTIKPLEVPEWVSLQNDIQKLQAVKFEEADITELTKEKSELNTRLSEVNSKLSVQAQIPLRQARIVELEADMKRLSQEIASFERDEFTIQEFTKAKVNAIEGKINSMFEKVKFKLFETQINGAEVETCQIMVNGVPFSDLNTAMRTYAGIDVINVISKFYNIYAPIVIDNRESISVIPETQSQVINLIKVKGQKTLKIE